MSDIALGIAGSIFLLLFSTIAFVDSVEVLSSKIRLTRFATGALMAAGITALPETIIAVTSPFYPSPSAALVGMGSVLAAPSITVLLAAPLVVVFLRNGVPGRGIARNYLCFSALMMLAVFPSQISLGVVKYVLALFFLFMFVYLARSVYIEEGEVMVVGRRSLAERFLKKESIVAVLLQLCLSSAGLPLGAELFIDTVSVNVNPFSLTLLFSPLATCLEEVLVAFYWMFRNKADLSLSLLSGENLIQSTFVVGVGMLFTEWKLPPTSLPIVFLYSLAAAVISLSIVKNMHRLATPVMLLYPLYVLSSL